MIQLECSNCKTLLSIDDAFAGGVCRCQHCGTIQTVPKPGKDASVAAGAASPKALFKRKARIESALNPYSDSLDRAADELGSSGDLSASAVANVPNGSRGSASDVNSASQAGTPAPVTSAPKNGKTPAAPKRPTPPPVEIPSYMPRPSQFAPAAQPSKPAVSPMLIAGCAAGMLVVVGAVTWFAMHRGSSAATQTSVTSPSPDTPKQAVPVTAPASAPVIAAVSNPAPGAATQADNSSGAICGMPVNGQYVVYLLDRSGCTQQAFQQMADTCFKSVQSLGPGRRYQIVILNNAQELAFPAAGFAEGSGADLDAARKAIADTSAGNSDIAGVLSRVTAMTPGAIVLVSATEMDQPTADRYRTALKDTNIKVYAVAVGAQLTGQQLRSLAGDLNGQFKQVDFSALQ